MNINSHFTPTYKYAPSNLGRKESVQWERKEDIPVGMQRGADYSDRLLMWDFNKFSDLAEKHFGDTGQMFYQNKSRTPEKIEQFLKEYFGYTNFILLYIIKGENVSNGYAYWVFGYAYKGES